jgi:RNA polymerase sigma-70 factor (ECF subfamily)
MEEKRYVRMVRLESDKEAFEKLFREYYKRLHGFAYSYVKQFELAEDVVQTVFLRIWSQRESWDPPGTVKHYLFAAVRNESLNRIRQNRLVSIKEDDVIECFEEYHSSTSDSSEYEELQQKIQCGIAALPPRCREIFLLSRRSGLTYTEISDHLDISINTVNTQMGRALKYLRDFMSDYLKTFVIAGISKLLF